MFIAAAAILSGAQIANGILEASNTRKQAERTAMLNEMNARYLEMEAYDQEMFGQVQVARYQTEIDQVIGSQRVGMASQNVDVSYGTAGEVQAETRVTGFMNQMEIVAEARNKAMGLRHQAELTRQGAEVAREQGDINADAQLRGSVLGAASTGLTAFGYSSKGSTGRTTSGYSRT